MGYMCRLEVKGRSGGINVQRIKYELIGIVWIVLICTSRKIVNDLDKLRNLGRGM